MTARVMQAADMQTGTADSKGTIGTITAATDLARRPDGYASRHGTGDIVSSLHGLQSTGRSLSEVDRAFFAARLGHDVGSVRIHTDTHSGDAARAIGARAFTVGQEIVFASGQYAPMTWAGRSLLAHELVHTIQQRHARHPIVQRQVYGPAAPTGAGTEFDEYLLQFQALEQAAIDAGYSLNDRVTAFRNIYYETTPTRTYAGVATGGGAWGLLIPGAAGIRKPAAWSLPGLQGAQDYLKAHQVITIRGRRVDVGHLLAGLDASNHPTSVSLAAGTINLRSNREAATFIGDLGSVVVEYIHGSPASFRDTAMVRSPLLEQYYDGAQHGMASPEDMAGNVDAYALRLDPSRSLAQNLMAYYSATTTGVAKRYTSFAAALGLGTFASGRFAGDTPSLRTALQEQVFNAALAYAAATGRRGDVVNVMADPGPGIFAPTYWESYWNVSEWVVDIFIQRVAAQVAAE